MEFDNATFQQLLDEYHNEPSILLEQNKLSEQTPEYSIRVDQLINNQPLNVEADAPSTSISYESKSLSSSKRSLENSKINLLNECFYKTLKLSLYEF